MRKNKKERANKGNVQASHRDYTPKDQILSTLIAADKYFGYSNSIKTE